jgi:hypothetical protein
VKETLPSSPIVHTTIFWDAVRAIIRYRPSGEIAHPLGPTPSSSTV